MKYYKVYTKNSTEIFDVETLLKNHKHNNELCEMFKKGKEEIIYTITGVPEIETFTIIFKRM